MTNLYEGMYLVDNDVVREDWTKAKALVTGAVEKHGGKVITARRWDERRLAYRISGKRRATYLLSYFEIEKDALPLMTRDLELNEHVLRYLQLAVDKVPETEFELTEAEGAADFTVPAPPGDDYVEEEVAVQPEETRGSAAKERTPATAEGEAQAPASAKGEGATEAAATETVATEAVEAQTAETQTAETQTTEAQTAETQTTEGEPVAAQED